VLLAFGIMPPRKERPAALSESIFRAKLAVEQAPNDLGGGMPEEIPVHNTFIQFGAPPGSLPKEKPLSTAPAWIGPSFQSMMQAAMESSVQVPSQVPILDPNAAAQAQTGAEGSEMQDLPALGSPKKVPVMRYSLSTSSARAAGLPEFGSVATVKPDFVGGNTLDNMGVDIEDGEGEEDDADSGAGPQAEGQQQPQPQPQEPEPQEASQEQPAAGNAEATAAAVAAAAAGELPSVGSALHAEGLCKRCCFFPKGRCLNGKDCEFCHFEHEKRKRKKKKKGAGARRDAAGSESEDDSQDEAAEAGAAPAAASKAAGAQKPSGSASTSAAAAAGAGSRPARGSGGAAPADSGSTAHTSPGALDPSSAGVSAAHEPPLGPLRAGLPLTAPPPLPPRGLPLPTEPPPPAPMQGMPPGAAPLANDSYYSGYDPLGRGAAGYGGMAAGYNRAVDPRISQGTVAQAYYNAGGYDAASLIAAQQQHNQQQQAAYGHQPQSKYLPPPR